MLAAHLLLFQGDHVQQFTEMRLPVPFVCIPTRAVLWKRSYLKERWLPQGCDAFVVCMHTSVTTFSISWCSALLEQKTTSAPCLLYGTLERTRWQAAYITEQRTWREGTLGNLCST